MVILLCDVMDSAAAVAAWRFAVASFSPAAKTALSGEGMCAHTMCFEYTLDECTKMKTMAVGRCV